MISRYDITVKEIENGWLFTLELPEHDPVTHYFDSEIKALAGAQVAIEAAIQNLIKQTQAYSAVAE